MPGFLGFWTRSSTGIRPPCFTSSSGSARRLVYIYTHLHAIYYVYFYVQTCYDVLHIAMCILLLFLIRILDMYVYTGVFKLLAHARIQPY